MIRPRRRRQSGFALLLIFAMAAAVSVTMYLEMPRVVFQAQRNKEELLIQRGEQYQRAIQLFVRKNKKYPQSLDEIEKFQDVRFLRRKYKDPMTGKDEWRLIKTDGMGNYIDSLVHKPKGQDEKTPSRHINEIPQAVVGGLPGAQDEVNQALRQRASDRPMVQAGGGFGGGGPVDPNAPPPEQPQVYPQQPYPGQPYPGQQGAPGQFPGQTYPGQAGQAYPGQPGSPGQPYPGQQGLPGQAYPGQATPGGSPYPGQPAYPGQTYPGQPAYPGQAYPGQPTYPGQSYPGQPSQSYPGQPAYPGQPYPGQPGQSYPGQPAYPGQTYPGQPSQPYPGQAYPGQPYPNQTGGRGGFNPNLPTPGGAPATSTTGGVGAPMQPGAAPQSAQELIRNMLFNPRQGGAPPGVTAPGTAPLGNAAGLPGGAPGAGGAAGGAALGPGIAGVATKADGTGIKIYNERTKYKEWEFLYDPQKDKSAQIAQGGASLPGSQPGSNPNDPLGGSNRSGQPGPGPGSSGSGFGQPGGGFGQPGMGQPGGFSQPGQSGSAQPFPGRR